MQPEKRTQKRRLIPHPTPKSQVMRAEPIPRNERKKVVDTYRDIIREAEAARHMVRKAKEQRDAAQKEGDKQTTQTADNGLSKWLVLFKNAQQQIERLRETHGDALEQAHRQYIREQVQVTDFLLTFRELGRVEQAIRNYAPEMHGFAPDPKKPMELRKRGVISEMARGLGTSVEESDSEESGKDEGTDLDELQEQLTDSLGYIFDDETTINVLSEEIEAGINQLRTETEEERSVRESEERKDLPNLSLDSLKKLQQDLEVDAEELWEKSGVKERWFERQLHQWIQSNLRGDLVLEFNSVVKHLNDLDDIERTYQNTTIGAVVVGEPGVGKTTLIQHFLEKKGRGYVYIDMSEEVTRYQLFGSPSLKQESAMDQYQHFAEQLAGMSEEEIAKLIQEHADKLEQSMGGLSSEERGVVALSQIRETLDEAQGHMDDNMKDQLVKVRGTLEGIVRKHYRSEAAKKLMDVTKKNGWRDGVVIHALRNGHSLIIDEFNKAKSWTLIHRLATSRPGEDFFFADNNENIPIPKAWRMYFTGNIGKKHGTFGVREAFASRIGGKVLEVDVPPNEEERTAMMTFLSDSDYRLMRPDPDIVRLMYFVKDIVPKLRGIIKDQRNVIPISYRLFRDTAEQLVDYKHEQPRPTTVDRALFNVLIRPYAVFETRDIPERLIKMCHTAGLLIGEEVEDEVIKWGNVTKDELKELRAKRADVDVEAVVREIYHATVAAMTAQMPARPTS